MDWTLYGIDWNTVEADGRVPVMVSKAAAKRLGLADYVVADDGEGTRFLCIVAGFGKPGVLMLRPVNRVVT